MHLQENWLKGTNRWLAVAALLLAASTLGCTKNRLDESQADVAQAPDEQGPNPMSAAKPSPYRPKDPSGLHGSSTNVPRPAALPRDAGAVRDQSASAPSTGDVGSPSGATALGPGPARGAPTASQSATCGTCGNPKAQCGGCQGGASGGAGGSSASSDGTNGGASPAGNTSSGTSGGTSGKSGSGTTLVSTPAAAGVSAQGAAGQRSAGQAGASPTQVAGPGATGSLPTANAGAAGHSAGPTAPSTNSQRAGVGASPTGVSSPGSSSAIGGIDQAAPASASTANAPGSSAGAGAERAVLPTPQPTPQAQLARPPASPTHPPQGDAAVRSGRIDSSVEPDPIAIPRVDLSPLDAKADDVSLIESRVSIAAQLSGAWEQLAATSDNHADFAPGGYSHSMIVIDSRTNQMFVYRGFGTTPFVRISGQFDIEFRSDGAARIAPSRIRPTKFSPSPRSVPSSSGGSVVIEPPAAAQMDISWNTDSPAETLVLAGKRYRRVQDEDRDRIIRGERPPEVSAVQDAVSKAAADGASSAASPQASPPSGSSKNVEFYGTQIRGRHVVFVLDRSGSMGQDGKFAAALRQLSSAISGLPADTSFYVVFFSSGAAEVQGFGGWTRAQTAAASQFLAELPGIGVGGGTDPTDALSRAFSLNPVPDEVFLMTDGLMAPGVREQLHNLNGRSNARSRVNTIAVGADADAQVLRDIASDHSGTFRAVR